MLALDFLDLARSLLSGHTGRPRQAYLRKAVSAAYYAVFYALCRNSADSFVGTSGADRSAPAWRQVFRAVDHGFAKRQCRNRQMMQRFPLPIQAFASSFVMLQSKRHDADYDPDLRLSLEEARECVNAATQAVAALAEAPLKDRRAFAVLVTIKDRP